MEQDEYDKEPPTPMERTRLPPNGIPRSALFSELVATERDDANWRDGRTWSLTYHLSDEHADLLTDVYRHFFSANGLSPAAFPSLRKFEAEVLAMLATLMRGGPRAAGSMTSGGTESILLAVKAHRDSWRSKQPRRRAHSVPEMVVPTSAHPAFAKAATYLDVRPVFVGVDETFRADLNAATEAISDVTICLVGSAPCYPYGVVDPIADLGSLALEAEIGLHVDACLGGMLLPFIERLGYSVPPFDLSVPGVSSVSVDLHKYGYAAKGASAVLYCERALHEHQFFAFGTWPGGLYGSPTMLGTRPGGIIASAWASLMSIGDSGYLDLARATMETTELIKAGILAIPGMSILGHPTMSVFAFAPDGQNVFSIARRLQADGWRIDTQRQPDSIHLIVTPHHRKAVHRFLEDLRGAAVAERCSPLPEKANEAALLYGVTTVMPAAADEDVEAFIRSHLSSTYSIDGRNAKGRNDGRTHGDAR